MSNWFTRLFVIPELPAPIASAAVDLVTNQSINPAARGETEQRSFTLKSLEAQRLFAFGTAGLSGVSVNNDSALSLPPFYACLRLISTGIAMLDRKVYKKKDNGLYPADEHPVGVLMRSRPHPHYTWFDMLAALMVNACMGNGYLLIHWDDVAARPEILEHLPGNMVLPEYDTAGGLWYNVSGELNGRSITKRFPSTDIIHIKGLTTNAINGRSAALTHQNTIGAGIASKEYSASIFGKSAHPSIALKYSQPLNGTERDLMADNFAKRNSGSANAGKPIVLDDGMSVQYLQWSPVDVALIDFATLNAEDCSRIFGVPRDLLALNNTGTYGAAVQRSQEFVTLCLGPWIEKLQEEFNSKLFYTSETRSGKYYFEFDRSMFLQLDKEAEAKTLALQVQSSLLTPNEARQKMGLNPIEGGDDLYGNINSLPLKDLVEVATAKYLSSEGEKLAGQNAASKTAVSSKSTTANSQKDTENEPTGQP